MKAQLIIARVKSRLLDEWENPRFENEEILQSLRVVYERLCSELELFIHERACEVERGQRIYIEDLARVLEAHINGKALPLASLPASKENALVYVGENSYLAPMTGMLRLKYVATMPLEDESTELRLSEVYAPLLTYGVLCDLLEIPLHSSNEARANVYAQRYLQEKAQIIALEGAKRRKNGGISPCVMV